MDAKDLKTESAVGARNDSNKYGQGSTITCDGNKPYQEVGSKALGKVDIQTSRPCAVIGPDRVVAPTSADLYPIKPPDQWLHTEPSYRRPPDYPLKMTDYQSPTRNISPRQTFQENMQRIMVPPSYSTMKINGDSDNNVPLQKNKLNISSDPKYCDVPYNISPLTVDQKNYKNVDVSVSIGNANVNQSAPYMWSSNSVQQSRPYGAPEFYPYAEYPGGGGVRTVPTQRPQRVLPDDASPSFSERYFTDGSVRFKPYPTLKDGYPQQRYECMNNYSNPYHPPPYPPPRYDLQKPVAPHIYPSYPQVPIKYIDNRIAEPAIDGFQPRPNPPPNYSVAFHNQFIHPAYGPVPGNCLQNKMFPYPPDLPVKQNHMSKLAYENNKVYSDFDSVRNKPYGMPEHYYGTEMPRTHPAKSQVMLTKHLPSNSNLPGHPYYRNPQYRNFEHISAQMRNPDYSLGMANSAMRFATHFSPNASSISPSELTNIHGSLQEESNYNSQKPVMSLRNADIRRLNTDMYGRYSYKYGAGVFRDPAINTDSKSSSSAKDKKNIDLRQFLQQWNDDDENNEANSSKQENKTSPVEQSLINQKVTSQEQLYVLGLVNVPSEELSKYEHIQKISKLPDNIKGYNSLELLNQFEEAIETSNLNNNTLKVRDLPGSYKQLSVQRATIPPLPRPVSPLDVEAKISQSVIHKEVGCNFEIKPCSPKMLNVEVAAPVQAVLDERVIEKFANPLGVNSPKSKPTNDISFSIPKSEENTINLLSTSLKNPSCKLTNTQFNSDSFLPSSKSNYSINDLEGNSGVCLASLPRLDNEIEFNFPEVNQQFIDDNKPDTVITTLIDAKSHVGYQQKSDTDSQLKDPTQLSPLVDSGSYPKLSKYRKTKKIENDPQMDVDFSVQAVRTDSVIIKNETAKESNINSALGKSIEMMNSPKFNEIRIQKSPSVVTVKSEEEEEKENLIDSFFESQPSSNDTIIDFSLNKNSYSYASSNYKNVEYTSCNNDQDFDNGIKVTLSSHKTAVDKSIDILMSHVDSDNSSLRISKDVESTAHMVNPGEVDLPNMGADFKKTGILEYPTPKNHYEDEQNYENTENVNIAASDHSLEFPQNINLTEEHSVNSTSNNCVNMAAIKAGSPNCNNLEPEDMCMKRDEKEVKCFLVDKKCKISLDSIADTDSKNISVESNIQSWNFTLDNTLDCYKKRNSLDKAITIELSLKNSLSHRETKSDNDYPNLSDNSLKNNDNTDCINNNKIDEKLQTNSENKLEENSSNIVDLRMEETHLNVHRNKIKNTNNEVLVEENCVDNFEIENTDISEPSNLQPVVFSDTDHILNLEKSLDNVQKESKDDNVRIEDNTSGADTCLVDNTFEKSDLQSDVFEKKGHHFQNPVEVESVEFVEMEQEVEKKLCQSKENSPIREVPFHEIHENTSVGTSHEKKLQSVADDSCNNMESSEYMIPLAQARCEDQLPLQQDNQLSGNSYDVLGTRENENSTVVQNAILNVKPVAVNCVDTPNNFFVKKMYPWLQKLMIYQDGKSYQCSPKLSNAEQESNNIKSCKNVEEGSNKNLSNPICENDISVIKQSGNMSDCSTHSCISEQGSDSSNSCSIFNNDSQRCEILLRDANLSEDLSVVSCNENEELVNTKPTAFSTNKLTSVENFVPTLKDIATQVVQNYEKINNARNLVVYSTKNLRENISLLEKSISPKSPSKSSSFRTSVSLKRSLSDSTLNIFDDQGSSTYCTDPVWPKRRRPAVHDNIQSNIFAENYCRLLQNHRRNSISTIFSKDVSFCILIDDNCIIAEECVDTDRNYLDEDDVKNKSICSRQNVTFKPDSEYIPDTEKSLDPWIDDVACVETVVSDNVDENEGSVDEDEEIYVDNISSPNHIFISEIESEAEETLEDNNSINNLSNEVKNKGCTDNESLVDTVFRTPQIEMNKLINNETHSQQAYIDADRQNLENILTGIDSKWSPNYELDVLKTDDIIAGDHGDCKNLPNSILLLEKSKVSDRSLDTINKDFNEKCKVDFQQKTQYDIIHSCESSMDNVFSYQDRENITKYSSSPEVSSTTSEEKCSSILLKITNYKGAIISELSNSNEAKRISCKYTENHEYNRSNNKCTAINRPLITKAAQKYIPPLCESIPDLKVKLPLPPQSLLKFKELKKTKEFPKLENKLNKNSYIDANLPKKIKPKFEDVLKSIDEIQIKMHKEKSKKVKKNIPKVVIKKNENGSHYTSSQNNDIADPDLTGRKWQPWVFIERNIFVDKMASKNKTKAIFSHRKNEFVLKESFRKYKSVSSAKFVITQPKLDDLSSGQLKYTIKLKHSF